MVRSSRQGAVWVIAPSGAVADELLDELRARLAEAAGSSSPRVVLDFSAATLINSAALEALLDAQEECRARGGDVKVACLSELLTDVFRVTGLDSQFDVYANVPAAIGSFAA